MALHFCPECNRKISDRARACPGCGFQLDVERRDERIQPLIDADPGEPGGFNARVVLPVPLIAQKTRLWCWAASAEMIMEYLGGPNIEQCDEANRYLVKVNCCSMPTPDGLAGCVKGGWPQFAEYGFDCRRTPRVGTGGAPLSWNELQQEIDDDRPIACSWRIGFGGHMVVVVGYEILGGQRYVHINDPWPPGVGDTRAIPYDIYVRGEEPGSEHWFDFYGIQQAAAPGGVMPAPDEEARAAATAFMDTAIELAGLNVPGGPETAYLDAGMPVLGIHLDRIRENAPGGNGLYDLIDAVPRQVEFPIMSRGKLVAATIAIKVDDQWIAAPGNVAFSRILTDVRRKHSVTSGIKDSDYSVISAKPLGLFFLAYSDRNGLQFIPTIDEPSLGFAANVPIPAEQAMLIIQKVAIEHNGQPG